MKRHNVENSDMETRHKDFYLKLREKVMNWLESRQGRKHKWAEYIALAPDFFHLLVKLTLDKDVPASSKIKLAGVIAYFISPVDVIPEILFGPAGYIDDLALAAYAINSLLNNVDEEVIRRNWAGSGDVLELIEKIINGADVMIGSGMWKRVKKRLRGF